jgi:PTS system maltose and glucose-specific IIC component
MSRAVNALQNFGKSLFGPVLILPIVGLFIAFGNIFGNGNLAEYLPFLGHPLIQHTGQLIAKSAVSVLANLALVFAVGIPVGLAARDKGYAALIGLVTFIVFINAMNVTMQMQGAGSSRSDESGGPKHGAGCAGAGDGRLRWDPHRRAIGISVQQIFRRTVFRGDGYLFRHCFVAIIMLPVSMVLGVS